MKKKLGTTSDRKVLGVMWLDEHSVSCQGSVSGDRFVAPKTPTFHTANR
jgi:hypothetical protein